MGHKLGDELPVPGRTETNSPPALIFHQVFIEQPHPHNREQVLSSLWQASAPASQPGLSSQCPHWERLDPEEPLRPRLSQGSHPSTLTGSASSQRSLLLIEPMPSGSSCPAGRCLHGLSHTGQSPHREHLLQQHSPQEAMVATHTQGSEACHLRKTFPFSQSPPCLHLTECSVLEGTR